MNAAVLKPFFIHAQKELIKHAPSILMGIGTGCGIGAVIFAAKVTPAAMDELYDARVLKTESLPDEEYDAVMDGKRPWPRLTIGEWFRACGKYYIPAIGLEVLSLTSFWSAHGINLKRQAILAGLYSTAQEALHEYQKKVQEMIGKDAEKEMHNAIAQDKVDACPPPTNTVILPDSAESWWIIDGQYFMQTYSGIKDAQNQANHHMLQHMYLSKAELYWYLDPMRKYLRTDGDEGLVGWNLDKLLVLDISWATDPNHRPVGVIEYKDADGFAYPPGPGYSAGL